MMIFRIVASAFRIVTPWIPGFRTAVGWLADSPLLPAPDTLYIIQEAAPAPFPRCQPLPPNPYPQFLKPEIHAAYDQCFQSQIDAGDDVCMLGAWAFLSSRPQWRGKELSFKWDRAVWWWCKWDEQPSQVLYRKSLSLMWFQSLPSFSFQSGSTNVVHLHSILANFHSMRKDFSSHWQLIPSQRITQLRNEQYVGFICTRNPKLIPIWRPLSATIFVAWLLAV